MNVITITGGIASGKTTVCNILEKIGCKVIDTDNIARTVTKKGKIAWKKLTEHFGMEILDSNDEINRVKFGNMVFNDLSKLKVLNKIVHPHILNYTNKTIKACLKASPYNTLVVDVPLFFEIFQSDIDSPVILVYVPEKIQIERLIRRNRYSKSEALARINSQISIEKKLAMSKIVIDNSHSLKSTQKNTYLVFQKLKKNLIKENKKFSGYQMKARNLQ